VLGLGGVPLAKAVEAHFHALGWDVCRTDTAAEAGRLAARKKTAAVLLAADALPESGLLSCAKLTAVRPGCRVVVVGPECGRTARYARLAGAVSYLPEWVGAVAVVRAVAG
jgi:DNA-binding response OmpR family regulator